MDERAERSYMSDYDRSDNLPGYDETDRVADAEPRREKSDGYDVALPITRLIAAFVAAWTGMSAPTITASAPNSTKPGDDILNPRFKSNSAAPA